MGKRFDFDSIKARMLEGLRKKSDWALILGNGTVGNLVDVIAESEAEDARYLEHLFRETKWETAQSISSLQAQSSLISYKRQLPQSALGYVIMSHTDIDGRNRLANYGQYFFDIDASSDYDDIIKNDDATEEEKHALVPWVNSTSYLIPKGTRFISSSGIEYFSTEAASSRSLSKAISKMNDVEKADFEKRGGWKGIKYLKIPVMQGIQRTVSIGKCSSTTRFQSFVLPTVDVDAASNSVSSSYFYVYVIPENSSTPVYFTEIDHLSRATSLDNVFEKSILKDESGVKIKFGDGVSGALPPDGIVYVHYVETLGSKGDITSKYQISQFILPAGYTVIDPRSDSNTSFLNVTNISTIEGGKDIEDVDDFRDNAPSSYLQSYTTATTKNYLNAILKYSPISLLHCKIFLDDSVKTTKIDYTMSESSNNVINKLISSSNVIYITAMQSNGELIPDDEVDDKFLNPLIASIKDIKSPTDKFSFVQPNLIEIVPSIKVQSSSYDYSQSDISDYVKEIIANEYDIFNQDFNKPLYESKIVSLAKAFKFSDNVSLTVEAVANIDYSGITSGTFLSSDSEVILKIPFSFDNIYMTDSLNQGFKDCRSNSDYLIKIDMKFINDASKQDKNRTFFLYDNRIDESGATSIFEAKSLLSTGETDPNAASNSLDANEKYFVLGKTNANVSNRQSRVAQFNYIEKITDRQYMQQLKDFSQAPLENLPFETDENGEYKTYSSITSLDDYYPIGNLYYKYNTKYIKGVDIDFTMSTNNNTLTGYFYIPVSYFGFSSVNSTSEVENDVIIPLLKQYVDIRIYAQPMMANFEPQKVNDIIYVNKDYMKVEKEQLS